jgi:hypothetical protein
MKKLLPKFQGRASQLYMLMLLVVSQFAFAQPTVLGTQVVNGAYVTYNLTTVGGFKQIRLQASSAAATGLRNWEFATGTAASTNYTTNWRPYTGGNTMSVNSFIPTSFANGAKYNTSSGGSSGLLPAIASGSYYTFNVSNNAAADNVMSLLETTFNPVTISSTTRFNNTVNIVTSGTPNAAEFVYVRYTTNAFASSTIVQATGSGTAWSATIPVSGAVTYYIYTSNRSKATIDGDVTSYGQGVHDMSTLSLNNNAGANYSFTATSIIAYNEITGTNPGQVAGNYTTGQVVNANASATGISKGAGITGNAANDRYNATGWTTGALDTTDYFEFTITPNATYRLNFTNFVYTGAVSSGGGSYSFRSSLDGYTADIGTPTGTGATISLTAGAYQNITSAITFRLYRYNTTGGTFSVNDYTFNGTVDLIPAAPFLAISGTTTHGSVCPTIAATPIQYTITNNGTVTATGVTVLSDDPQFVVSGLSSTTIASGGGTATYNVTFTPSSAGAKTATVTVASVTSGSNSPTSSLTGTGTTPITATVTSSAATLVSNTTATLNGNVTALGVCPATTQKGFVYSQTSVNANPLNGGTGVTTTLVAGVATGTYTLPLSSLSTGTGYTFKAYVYDGTTYTYGATTTFTTLLPADHLTFVGVPSTGNVNTNLTSFTVEARRPDNSVDATYTGNITISKASGPGALSGTLTVAAVAGVATFGAAQFDTVGTVSLAAAASGLTGTTSGNITITLAPVVIYQHPFDTGTFSGTTYTQAPSTLATGLSSSQWAISAGTFQSFTGATGTALGVSSGSGSTPYTLTFTVVNGYVLNVNSFSFWKQTSNSVAVSSITINGIAVGSATSATGSTGTQTVTNAVAGLTGAITVVLNLTGTGSFRLDDFTLRGNVLCIDPIAFNVTGGATVCATGSGTPIGLSGSQSNISYQLKLGGVNNGVPVAGTGSSISFGNHAAGGTYTVEASNTNGTCNLSLTMNGSAVVTANPASVGGTITGAGSVCTGSNSTLLTLAGNTGTIQWQSSTDNITFADISGETAATYTATNLTQTTYYRAVVTSGVCSSANSNTVTMTVNPASVGGTITGQATVCSGTNSALLTLGSSVGAIQWQSSTDNITFADISGETGTTYTATNLTVTTYYRAVVTSGVCSSANSNTFTITVSQPSVGGTVSGSTSVCSVANSGTLTLGGYTGTITKWQSADDAAFTVNVLDIPNASDTLGYTNLAQTTYYRAVVTSGACASANSSIATITVDSAANAGSIAGDASVCYGNNSGSVTVSGYSGTITGWQSSLDNFATTATPINNTTATQSYSNLTVTTYYRAVLSGGACGSIFSPVATITVLTANVWTGAANTTWEDAGNWSCGTVPTAVTDVQITAATNQPAISSNITIDSLTMDTATTLVVPAGFNLTVNDAVVTQGTASLTVQNDANLLQVNDVDNTGDITVERDSNPLMRLDYTLWSSPVDNQNLLDFSPATIATRFYVYNPATDVYNSIVPSTNDFVEGTGYLIRMPDNHPATPTVWNGSFTGEPHNGNVDLTVTGGTYNAVGNPYPSTIDADAFINQNNLSEALYFWRKTNNVATTSYATYTLAGGAGTDPNAGDPLGLIPNGVIQVGQGFIAKSTSATLSFNNGMRVADNNGQFFRSAQVERNRIWLNLTNAESIFSQTMVAYMTGATQGVDSKIDGLFFNDSQVALTSIIEGSEYAVQGRALPFADTDEVPLGFKAITAGNYTIALDHADGLFEDGSQDIYLKDNNDNSMHDLRQSSYAFASEAGVFNGRFEIIYQTTLGVSNPVLDAHSVVVYKQGQDIVINSGNQAMAGVKVFDIRGRLLAQKENINAAEVKLFAGSSNQVLIVKVIGQDGKEVTKKIMN